MFIELSRQDIGDAKFRGKKKNIAWYGPNMKEPVIKRTGVEGQVPQ